MRFVFVLIALLFAATARAAEPISFPDAVDAAETGRPIVCIVSATWCPHCRHLANRMKPGQVPFSVLETDKPADFLLVQHNGILSASLPTTWIIYRAANATGWTRSAIIGDVQPSVIESAYRNALAESARAMQPPFVPKLAADPDHVASAGKPIVAGPLRDAMLPEVAPEPNESLEKTTRDIGLANKFLEESRKPPADHIVDANKMVVAGPLRDARDTEARVSALLDRVEKQGVDVSIPAFKAWGVTLGPMVVNVRIPGVAK